VRVEISSLDSVSSDVLCISLEVLDGTFFLPLCEILNARFSPLETLYASFYNIYSYVVRIPNNSSRGMTSRSLEVLRAVSWAFHLAGKIMKILSLISY